MAPARGHGRGASPATTMDDQRRSPRGIVVAPLAGAMSPCPLPCLNGIVRGPGFETIHPNPERRKTWLVKAKRIALL